MMRQMLGDFFARSPVLVYPLIAMLLFGSVFLAVLVVTWCANPKRLERLAQLPLEGEERQSHG